MPHYDTSLAGLPVMWEGVRSAAQTAERAGFDSLWVSDHLFLDWSKYGGPPDKQGSLECLTTMSALAGVTSRVRIGSLTLCNDLRNPALVAKMVATLDLLSDGRIDVGLGGGWYEPEYEAAGIPFDPAGKRIRRMGEAAEIISRLLRGEELVFAGEHYELDGAICRPLPKQQPAPPIWMGGKGDLLLKIVAERADGWNYSWIGSEDTYRDRVRVADAACVRAGRDPATLRRSVGAYLLTGTTEEDAERRFRRLAERTPDGVLPGSSGGAAVSWKEFHEGRVAGTASEVVDRFGRLSELGVEEVIVSLGVLPFQVADLEDIEMVGAEIAPALR
jgi:probable F420-dependent oxidoreductase